MSVTAPAKPGSASRTGSPSGVQHTLMLAGRYLRHIKADPEQIANMTIFPVMFLLLFVYVFGGAIAGSSREYLQFAVPGILVSTAGIICMQTAVSLSVDMQRGIIDRFRSLPMAPTAVIGGRILADSVRMLWGTVVILLIGTLLGFRPSGSVLGILGAVALITLFGVVISWPLAVLGVGAGSVETANNMSFLIVLPLSFFSSVYAPIETMPGPLEAFARVNPFTHAADAARVLLHGESFDGELLAVAISMVVITAVFAPLAVFVFKRKV